jgi:hypothetical protein
MLVLLPSEYSGGTLKFVFKESCTEVDVALTNATSVTCVIFYNAMTVTSEIIRSGTRVALIYDLTCRNTAHTISPLTWLDRDLARLNEAMSHWKDNTNIEVLMRTLKHVYVALLIVTK